MQTNIQCQESFSVLISQLINPIAQDEIIEITKEFLSDRCHEIAVSMRCEQLNGQSSWISPGVHSVREIELLLYGSGQTELLLWREAANYAVGVWFERSFATSHPTEHYSLNRYLSNKQLAPSCLLEILNSEQDVSKDAYVALCMIKGILVQRIHSLKVTLYDHAIKHAANLRAARALKLVRAESALGDVIQRSMTVPGARRFCVRQLVGEHGEISMHEFELFKIDPLNRISFSTLPLAEIIARVDQMLLQTDNFLTLHRDDSDALSGTTANSTFAYNAKIVRGHLSFLRPDEVSLYEQDTIPKLTWPANASAAY